MNAILLKIGRTFVFIIFSLFFVGKSNAQFSQTYFYDTLTNITKEGYIKSSFAEGKYLYIGGSSFSSTVPLPTLTKVDTAGNTIWTAIDNDNYNAFGGYQAFTASYKPATCYGTIKSGDRIYTGAGRSQASYLGGSHFEVWCLSDSSGAMLWKASLGSETIAKLVDYNDTSIIAITEGSSASFYVLNKKTGSVITFKALGSNIYNPDVFVDNNHNILLSHDYVCSKYRDNKLSQQVWISSYNSYGSYVGIDKIAQDSGHYIFIGVNNVRSVDTLTGNTNWITNVEVGHVPGYQGGDDGAVSDFFIKDSLIYVTWHALYTGSVDLEKGFTLTCINKNTGKIRFNVAYDFTGIPADPVGVPYGADGVDYPSAMCMDANKQIYMTGSYDSHSTWGVMKIDGLTGSKLYEATITNDSTQRTTSEGQSIYYFNGKLYITGNLQKKVQAPNTWKTDPTWISFDTGVVYKEHFRAIPTYSIRYPSSLIAISPLGKTKMVLLKKVGRSGIVEVRSNNNKLIWSKSFNNAGKFWVPQSLAVLSDTAIALSFETYLEDPDTKILMNDRDSLVFVSLDTLGNTRYYNSIKYKTQYDLSPMPTYTDKTGKTNFIFKSIVNRSFAYKGYMLNGAADSLNYVSTYTEVEPLEYNEPTTKLTPFQYYNRDTMINFQAGIYAVNAGWLKSTTQAETGYKSYGYKPISHYVKTYSNLNLGLKRFLVMGRDSSGYMRCDLYDYNLANSNVWAYNPPVRGSIYNADSSSNSVYIISKPDTDDRFTVSRLNRQTGALLWSFDKITDNPTTLIMPGDFKYDPVNGYFCVGGYFNDYTIPNGATGSEYFYLVLDSGGKVIKDEVVSGEGLYDNQVRSINVLSNGIRIFGGTISTSARGTIGFYNSDCDGNDLTPSVVIEPTDTAICNQTSVTFTASATYEGDQPIYQWQINGNSVGTGTNTFTTSVLKDGDKIKVTLTSSVGCVTVQRVESNEVQITVYSEQAPIVSIAGDTDVNKGESVVITAVPGNAGTGPTYQWQDSTLEHNWQNIEGSTNTSATYTPALTGDAIRCMMKSNTKCSGLNNIKSNVLSFTVHRSASDSATAPNDGIVFYPNPVYKILTLDSLKLEDQWQTLNIVSITGNQHLVFKNISNQTKVTVDVEQLPKGLYIALLEGKQRKTVQLKFIKL